MNADPSFNGRADAAKPRDRKLPARVLVALALLALACAVTIPAAYRAVRALLVPSAAPAAAALQKGDTTELAAARALALGAMVNQIDGRSLFWTPAKPGETPTVVVEEEEEADPGRPAPSRYDGPAIVAIVLDTVWFDDGTRLRPGDEKKKGLEVVSTNAPWDAKVRYEGGEFTVPFFTRDKIVFKENGKNSEKTPEKVSGAASEAKPVETAENTDEKEPPGAQADPPPANQPDVIAPTPAPAPAPKPDQPTTPTPPVTPAPETPR